MLVNWNNFKLRIHEKGGGGGSSSGEVGYPAYMETFHGQVLNNAGVDTIASSITDIMNTALGNSPFAAEVAYDPDVPITAMETAVADLDTLVALLSAGTGLDAIIANMLSDVRIDDAVTEYSLDLGDRLTIEVIPRFEAGMRTINAVVSSAFPIGRAIIEDGQVRQVAKYGADLHMKAWGDDALRLIALKLQFQKDLTHMGIETNRMKIVAKKEQTDGNLKIDEADALWDLELFQFGSNVLASIGSGVVNPKMKGPSTAQSVIGGAMSGAAAGAMVGGGNPLPIFIGGLLGGAAGLLD